jgi:hypothetical protein
MNKLIRTLMVLIPFALTSALFAGSKTYNIGYQSGTVSVAIEMYWAGDYTFELINNDTNEVVARLSTITSMDYSHSRPDWIWEDYYAGASGTAGVAGSWGGWDLSDVPTGSYSIVAFDYTYSNQDYDMSSVFTY